LVSPYCRKTSRVFRKIAPINHGIFAELSSWLAGNCRLYFQTYFANNSNFLLIYIPLFRVESTSCLRISAIAFSSMGNRSRFEYTVLLKQL
jgi:hypothetical protein